MEFFLASSPENDRIDPLSRSTTYHHENSYHPPHLLLAHSRRFMTVSVLAAAVFPCALAQQYVQSVSVIPGQAFQLGNVTYVPATSAQTVIPIQQVPSQPTSGQSTQKLLPLTSATTATPATVIPAVVPSTVRPVSNRPHSRYEAPPTSAPGYVASLTTTPPTPTVATSPTITLVSRANKPNFSIEITGSYNLATRRIYSGYEGDGPEVNTTGIDMTFLYHINPKNAITFRVGYSFGTDDETNTVYAGYGSYIDYNLDFDVSNLYFMPGYRGSTSISDSASLFWGFNLGIVSEHVKATETIPGYFSGSISASEVGFAYSIEVGTSIRFSPNAGIVMAAILSGSTAEPSEDGEKIKQQVLNPGLRFGVTISF